MHLSQSGSAVEHDEGSNQVETVTKSALATISSLPNNSKPQESGKLIVT